MFLNHNITSIRILPNDKTTFKTNSDFRTFIENVMVKRGGYYYFPKAMMHCPNGTLVLFQYGAAIRAVGVLIESKKEEVFDEIGNKYAGCYRFDINTLHYLDSPIAADTMKESYPQFSGYSMAKLEIPMEYFDNVVNMLKESDAFFFSRNDDTAIDNLIDEIEQLNLQGETKEAVVKIRVNQGIFRDRLLYRHKKCCLCGVSNPTMLIASHIKPWKDSGPREKLDMDNGFLMCPNHDRLFDQGLITFDANGSIVIAKKLSENDRMFLNVRTGMKITLTEGNKKYLKFHRKNVFQKV